MSLRCHLHLTLEAPKDEGACRGRSASCCKAGRNQKSRSQARRAAKAKPDGRRSRTSWSCSWTAELLPPDSSRGSPNEENPGTTLGAEMERLKCSSRRNVFRARRPWCSLPQVTTSSSAQSRPIANGTYQYGQGTVPSARKTAKAPSEERICRTSVSCSCCFFCYFLSLSLSLSRHPCSPLP